MRPTRYPTAGITIIVGFPPGGPLDLVARAIATPVSERIGVPVSIDNRVGAGGDDATWMVIRARPDGGTLLLCGPVNAINATLFPRPEFDFARDIMPVAGIASVPLIVEVHPSVPARSIAELIAHARELPGALRVAYAGKGTPQHVAIELFQHLAGVRLTLVPHPGSASALADVLEGRAHAMFDPAPSSMPHIRAGRLIALATTGRTRAETLPEIPTVAEVLPGYEAGSWFGLGAPRGTPTALIERLNTVVNESLAEATVRQELAKLGARTMPGSAAWFGSFLIAETARYAEIIRVADIRAR